MTTETRAPAKAALRRYTIDDAWLAAHDKAVIEKVTADLVDRVNRAMPGHNAVIARRYAQAGADAVVAPRLAPWGRV